MELSKKITHYKKLHGLTNKELADLSKVPIGTVDKILSGRTNDPKLETLKALANALECTLDDLVDNIPAKKEAESNSLVSYEDVKSLLESNIRNFSLEEKILLVKLLCDSLSSDC